MCAFETHVTAVKHTNPADMLTKGAQDAFAALQKKSPSLKSTELLQQKLAGWALTQNKAKLDTVDLVEFLASRDTSEREKWGLNKLDYKQIIAGSARIDDPCSPGSTIVDGSLKVITVVHTTEQANPVRAKDPLVFQLMMGSKSDVDVIRNAKHEIIKVVMRRKPGCAPEDLIKAAKRMLRGEKGAEKALSVNKDIQWVKKNEDFVFVVEGNPEDFRGGDGVGVQSYKIESNKSKTTGLRYELEKLDIDQQLRPVFENHIYTWPAKMADGQYVLENNQRVADVPTDFVPDYTGERPEIYETLRGFQVQNTRDNVGPEYDPTQLTVQGQGLAPHAWEDSTMSLSINVGSQFVVNAGASTNYRVGNQEYGTDKIPTDSVAGLGTSARTITVDSLPVANVAGTTLMVYGTDVNGARTSKSFAIRELVLKDLRSDKRRYNDPEGRPQYMAFGQPIQVDGEFELNIDEFNKSAKKAGLTRKRQPVPLSYELEHLQENDGKSAKLTMKFAPRQALMVTPGGDLSGFTVAIRQYSNVGSAKGTVYEQGTPGNKFEMFRDPGNRGMELSIVVEDWGKFCRDAEKNGATIDLVVHADGVRVTKAMIDPRSFLWTD
ncbi:MAG: hypothetical protein A2289_20670 [Deltaproteobacteria bacterium RIFOXYA12_FULL_58_15]|nr:MAG: hypothetical protein A2289_20670 [Deltaproteobacteria bacterium RIFOXYA12_FULL_58_15]OGR12224.1 MAG: hypothetical protein A2341_21045 [Deltaproteobacteria bacterium RIFOXYB12_FULL_58_9]